MLGIKSKPLIVLTFIFLVILALLPFHAFFSTWAISNFGAETIFKGWKELLLLFVALPIGAWVVINDKNTLNKLTSSRINQLVVIFLALNVASIALVDEINQAVVAGLVFNLRFFAIFLLAQILILKINKPQLEKLVFKIIFASGLLVVVFGALQVLLLPNDFLRHFGYSDAIIKPYFTVDNNENYVRILSTLRGPNALGAYLVFWLPFLVIVTKKVWKTSLNWRVWAVSVWLASLITLYGSGSRSAWAASLVALSVMVYLQVQKKYQKYLLYAAMATGLGLFIGLLLAWNTTFVQITLLHRDPAEQSVVDSDDQRANSLATSIQDIIENPFGQGVGSAGLASTYGTMPQIVENYYLLVGVELGLAGLILLISIVVLVILRLWSQKNDEIVAALLAGLAGILLINLVLPAWSDETVSMLWWGVAGLFMWDKAKVKHLAKKAKA